MKGEHGQETSDGRKNRAGKLNYIAGNKYKILTFVLAGLVIANATAIMMMLNNAEILEINWPGKIWAGARGKKCDGLNEKTCKNKKDCIWDDKAKGKGQCISKPKKKRCTTERKKVKRLKDSLKILLNKLKSNHKRQSSIVDRINRLKKKQKKWVRKAKNIADGDAVMGGIAYMAAMVQAAKIQNEIKKWQKILKKARKKELKISSDYISLSAVYAKAKTDLKNCLKK